MISSRCYLEVRTSASAHTPHLAAARELAPPRAGRGRSARSAFLNVLALGATVVAKVDRACAYCVDPSTVAITPIPLARSYPHVGAPAVWVYEIWLYLNLSISFYLDKSKSTDLSPNPAKPSSNSPMGKSPLWPFGVRGVTKM